VRIDLARSAGTDFEQIVLTIRAALTRTGRPLPAFDLALRRYWEANHPGEPLEEYLRAPGSNAGAGYGSWGHGRLLIMTEWSSWGT